MVFIKYLELVHLDKELLRTPNIDLRKEMGECYVGQNLISAEGFRVRHFGVTHDGVEPVAGDADNIDFFQPLDIGVAFTALTNVVKDKLGTAHTTAVEFRLRKC